MDTKIDGKGIKTMFYYGFEIKISSQEDINQLFREESLETELCATQNGTFFICPVLSRTKWSLFPQKAKTPRVIDKKWNEVLEKSKQFLEKNFQIDYVKKDVGWYENSLFRCSKMENFLRHSDIEKEESL